MSMTNEVSQTDLAPALKEAISKIEQQKAEIEALTQERHQLRNELTAARLERERLNGEVRNLHATIGEIDRQHATELQRRSDEPNLLSITEAELNAALLPVAKHMNAQLRQYWAMPAKEFSELAWNALIDEMGSEQTNVLYALCARLSPEWEREAEEGAKIDPTPQKSNEHPAAAHYRSLEQCICADGSAGEYPVHR